MDSLIGAFSLECSFSMHFLAVSFNGDDVCATIT